MSAEVTVRFKVFTGPVKNAIGAVADALREDGFGDILLGTEHVYATCSADAEDTEKGFSYFRAYDLAFDRVVAVVPWLTIHDFEFISATECAPDEDWDPALSDGGNNYTPEA